jgi:hypothetical protein
MVKRQMLSRVESNSSPSWQASAAPGFHEQPCTALMYGNEAAMSCGGKSNADARVAVGRGVQQREDGTGIMGGR